jgi:hypothetical protein
LEADKAVDEQAGAEGGYEAVLGGGEVRVGGRTRGSDASIEDERDNGQKEVDVEERSDLLAACSCVSVRLCNYSSSRAHTNSGELGADVEDHDDGHDEGQNVHEVVRDLEDKRVCDLNGACIALGLYASAAIDLLVADERAQRYRRLCAYCGEVAKAHDEGCSKDLGGVAVVALFFRGGGEAVLCMREPRNSEIWAERQPKAWQQRPEWVGSGEGGLIASVVSSELTAAATAATRVKRARARARGVRGSGRCGVGDGCQGVSGAMGDRRRATGDDREQPR